MAAIAITPEASLNPGQLKALRDQAAAVAQAAVRSTTGRDLTVRPLTPTDFFGANQALFNNSTAIAAASTPTPQAGIAAVRNSQAYAVFGYAALAAAPLIDELWLGIAAATYAKIRLVPLFAQGSARSKVGYFEPIYFATNDTPVLTLMASAAVLVNAEAFELIGYVAETPQNVVNQTPIASNQPATRVPG